MLIIAGCSAGNAKEELTSQEIANNGQENQDLAANNEENHIKASDDTNKQDNGELSSNIEKSINEGQTLQGQDQQGYSQDKQEPSQQDKQEPNNNEELSESSTNVGKDENGKSSPEIEVKNLLKIQGAVEEELFLTVDDLKSMDDIIFEADFYSLNSFGTTGYTHFKGVKLWDLLKDRALIKTDVSKVSIIAQDGYKMEFTLEQVKKEYMDETNPDNKYPMIIAWEENGAEYTTEKGAPYKLVVGQTEPGDVNKPQWVSNIDVIIIE